MNVYKKRYMAEDKKILLNGVFWNAIQKYSGLVVNIAVSMVLARLLTPEDFGIVAIATVLISFLTMICDMGIGPAIIQRQDLEQKDLDNIYSFTLYVGMGLSLLLFVSSWGIANFYQIEQLKFICQILSVVVLFSAMNMVPNALMTKNFKFREIAKRTLILQVVSGIISVIAAFVGAGVYSLLISPIFTAIGIFFYNRLYFKLSFHLRVGFYSIRKIFSYSAYQFMFKFINFFSANIDKIIIGKTISPALLGQYHKAFQLVQLPLSNVDSVITPVLHPLLAKYQSDKDVLIERYNKVIGLLALIGVPMGVIMFFCGDVIIRFFYGSQWDIAIPSFKYLSLAAPLYIILACCGSFFQASNNTKLLFQLGVINSTVAILAIMICAFYFRTIEAVALSWCFSMCSNFFWTQFFIYKRILKRSVLDGFKVLLVPLYLGLILSCLCIVADYIFRDYIYVSLFIKVLSFICILLLGLKKTGYYEFIKNIKK